ncbi:ABC-type nitrate/sulfonate/bicarbonate transport system, ATPase component [Gottschalkia purinilytica]|uniref:ABC-type nitrate/sulfonate/bicarbonate transport system, ATPase component n=1 Tax=Gottschalkia purinilytica TaxID=1503 RepID=A0A0L0W9N8_GOTPU|nr:ABC transporter ATP-binding protein [Gottschalkia purinilytica]KNF08161.1 ABC-type nitrate/sulfonate/bicarbonate transport system, ATPase component [Gottschalkia purinilytica]
MKNNKLVEIKNIGMSYHTLDGETLALKDISLDINHGEVIVMVGPSGCGKSTLLSIISGLIKPSKGSVYINGKEVTEPGKNIGYMFQRDNLFEWRTIIDNILIGLEIQNKLNNETLNFVEKLIDTYGLSEFKYHYPRQLSGGMRQRVALIRTLAVQPDLLLLDEPFSALDYHTRLNIADEVSTILKKEGKTALMITHDISEAISMANRVVILSSRPATVKEIVDIELNCPDNDSTPMKCREAPEFRHYFNKIWKELDVHVK